MDICFYGVGGVGGYYGTLVTDYLHSTGKGKAHFIARGKHKDAISEKGILLKKNGGKEKILAEPFLCSDTVDDLPVCDIVVLSVKGYDLENAAKEINKITNKFSVILPLLNGVDIYDRTRQHLTEGYVLPSCLYLSSYIESPGVIFHNGGSGQILAGKDSLYPEFYPEKLISLFKEAGILIEFVSDVNVEIWKKYIFIAPFALVTAAYDKTIGEVAEDRALGTVVKNIMREIVSIAGALEIELPPDIVETSFSKAGQFPFEAKTSFQKDVETKGRRSEWDLFGAAIMRYAERLGISADNAKETLERLFQSPAFTKNDQ